MAELSPEQLNSLDKETLIIIINSLSAQLDALQTSLILPIPCSLTTTARSSSPRNRSG